MDKMDDENACDRRSPRSPSVIPWFHGSMFSCSPGLPRSGLPLSIPFPTLRVIVREAMEYDGWFIGSPRGSPGAVTIKRPASLRTTLWGPPGSGRLHTQPQLQSQAQELYKEGSLPADRGSLSVGNLVLSSTDAGSADAAAGGGAGGAGGSAGGSEGMALGPIANSFMLDHQHSLELQFACPKVSSLPRKIRYTTEHL